MAEQDVFAALEAEGDDVDRMVAELDEAGWRTPTPAEGWTVAHQIAHLTATFRMAGLAAADPDGFQALMSRMSGNFDADVNAAMAPYLAEAPAALLARWREERALAEKALAAVPVGQPVPWLVRPLPAPVLAAAGMMELFGHGQDIADALGVRRRHTDRLRPLVEFAVRTWDFGYLARGLEVPAGTLRFIITAPSGAVWHFGPPNGEQIVNGPAEDFCLLVTRRRHRDDLSLRATGAEAHHWLDIAQAYRGPAGPGRQPGQFATS
ncbi:TIGR03084 family metal-binding protein [Micromonospora peucetia]|uniref:TIGR03084 family metal-binding protein n=1 Tax=Micromonospora peucetia TaxID=47871 RepID=A0ABZ1E9E7_9ACTN|nr:TIGR03084 family metal-binding protein [Micromonospora peucetia]WSA31446.1 TIGR03084 family metal-binding protein [Micromonospora peucetia]